MKSNLDETTELELLRDLFSRVMHKEGIFMCGQSEDKDEHGMPKRILVCPAEGVDEARVYVLQEYNLSHSSNG